MYVNFVLLITFCVTLMACAPKNTDDKPHGVLSDAQKQTLEKSKKVENVLNNANKERMQEADENTSEK